MAEVVNVPKIKQSSLTRETSTLSKPIESERPGIEKVELKGTVVTRKPSFISRLKETFIADDARDVGDYIVWDILVPTIKRTIRDIIVGSADRVFLGSSSPNSSSSLYRERGVTYVKRTDYGAVTRPSRNKNEQKALPSSRPQYRNFKLNEIIFDNYDDAANVLERMIDYLDTYGKVSVDAYFDLAGQSIDYTAQNWGWTSLSSATIVTTFGGYFIKLPNPVVIKE